MSGGSFMVSRSIWNHPDFAPSEFSEREAFLWLVSEAAWKARRVRAGNVVVDLERGQLCASVRFMATAWMWSKSRVARFIKKLEKVDVVRSDVGTGQLVITLCNYDKFQVVQDSRGTAAGQHISKNDEMRSKSGTAQVDASPCNESEKQGERDSSGTAAGQQRDSSGTNDNKGNKGNKDNTLTNVSDGQAVDFTKEVFDRGIAFLGKYGTPERQARALIGKWRRQAGDTETFNALRDANREGVTEPVAWITARLRPREEPDLDGIFKDVLANMKAKAAK